MKDYSDQLADIAWDKASAKIDKLNHKIDVLDSKLNNANTVKEKNRLLNKQLKIQERIVGIQHNAVIQNGKDLNKTKDKVRSFLPNAIIDDSRKEKILDKISNNKKIGLNGLTGDLLKWVTNYNECLDELKENNQEFIESQEELISLISNNELKKFNNIKDEKEHLIGLNNNKQSLLQSQIDLAKEQGQKITSAMYEGMISVERGTNNHLVSELNKLQKQLNEAVRSGAVKEGTSDWWEMVEAINSVKEKINESALSIVEMNNRIRQLRWNAFDGAITTIDRLNKETDFYLTMIANEKLINDENGSYTRYGATALSLYNQKMETALETAKAYKKEFDDISASADLSDENVIQHLRELQDGYYDSMSAAESAKKSMIDLVRQGFDAQLSALQKLTNKYKDLKNSEMEAYNYQKSISEKAKNISTLQKQLIAWFANSDSEESRAQIQQLQMQLKEAQQDLQDTQYERFISDTEDMLDDLYSDFEGFLNDKLDDTNTILGEISEYLSDNGSIVPVLDEVDSGIGKVSSTLSSILTSVVDIADYVSKTVKSEKDSVDASGNSSYLNGGFENSPGTMGFDGIDVSASNGALLSTLVQNLPAMDQATAKSGNIKILKRALNAYGDYGLNENTGHWEQKVINAIADFNESF